jgi:hypothetical protein
VGRSRASGSLGQGRIPALNHGIVRYIFQGRQGADPQMSLFFPNGIQPRDRLNIYESFGIPWEDFILHLSQQVGASGDDAGLVAVSPERSNRFFHRPRIDVLELSHQILTNNYLECGSLLPPSVRYTT